MCLRVWAVQQWDLVLKERERYIYFGGWLAQERFLKNGSHVSNLAVEVKVDIIS